MENQVSIKPEIFQEVEKLANTLEVPTEKFINHTLMNRVLESALQKRFQNPIEWQRLTKKFKRLKV
jgi:hypothetical protein